jgi:DnaK suppressor protein
MTASVLSAAELAELQARLETLRVENEADLEAAQATMAALAADHTAIDPALHEVGANAEYMIQDASSILAQIAAAMGRLEAGTYGICTNCEQPILKARLELRPYVPTCVGCSS